MKNHWLINHRKDEWIVQITGNDAQGLLNIFEEPFQKDFEWEAPYQITVSMIEVLDSNDFPIWSQHMVMLPTVGAGDVLKIGFDFEP